MTAADHEAVQRQFLRPTILQCELQSASSRRPTGARFGTRPAAPHPRKSWRVKEIGAGRLLAASGGTAIAMSGSRPKEVTVLLYWLMVLVMVGVGIGWVTVRRRRKADAKTA